MELSTGFQTTNSKCKVFCSYSRSALFQSRVLIDTGLACKPVHVPAGWAGGSYGSGHRISLTHTRAIIDAIHSGQLQHAAYVTTPYFNLQVRLPNSNSNPQACSMQLHEAPELIVCIMQWAGS